MPVGKWYSEYQCVSPCESSHCLYRDGAPITKKGLP